MRPTSGWLAALALAGPQAPAPEPAVPEHYREVGWTMSAGLPQDDVQAIAQTADGYLWVGTKRGLARFDGVRFEVLDRFSEPALPAEGVSALLADPRGPLWIGTGGGLARLRDGALELFGAEQGLTDVEIKALALDGEGRLWVGTRRGVFRQAGERFAAALEGELAFAQALAAGPDGSMWIGTLRGRLLRAADGRVESVSVGDEQVRGIGALLATPAGGLWVGTLGSGLIELLPDGTPRRLLERDGIPADALLRALARGASGELWVGGWDGLLRGRDGSFEGVARLAKGAHVVSLLVGRDGGLWVGTLGAGLRQLRAVTFDSLTAEQGLPSDRVTALLEDRAGGLWIGTGDAGVARWDGRGFERYTEREGLSDDSVFTLALDAEGALWIGGAGGIDRLSGGELSSWPLPAGVVPPIWAVASDEEGGLWIGHLAGTGRLVGGRYEPVADGHTAAATTFLTLGERTLLGTPRGLLEHARGRLRALDLPAEMGEAGVLALHRSEDGAIWVGTSSGLARLEGERSFFLGDARGLHTGGITWILEDGSDFWLGCTQGIVRVARGELDAVLRGEAGRVSARLFDVGDGLPASQCNGGFHPAGARTRDGRLWFPTARGLAVVDPRRVVPHPGPPAVLLDAVLVDGRLLDRRRETRLAPDSRTFELRYTAFDFAAPERLRFRYRLEGYDEDWIDAGTRRVAWYMNLDPGPYTFRVEAMNGQGVWSRAPAVFAFELRPHLYAMAWFHGLLALLVVATLWGAYRWRRRSFEREFSVVLAERSRMARELHDTLAQGLAGISIQLEAAAETLRSSPDEAEAHLDRARGLARTSLTEARRSVFALRPGPLEQSDLGQALARVLAESAWGTEVEATLELRGTPRPLPRSVEDNVLRVCQEAARNALRHGRPARVRAELEFLDYEVVLRVADDGCGFDPAASAERPGGGFGLVGMRERAEEIEGSLTVESSRGRGTTVTLAVPVR